MAGVGNNANVDLMEWCVVVPVVAGVRLCISMRADTDTQLSQLTHPPQVHQDSTDITLLLDKRLSHNDSLCGRADFALFALLFLRTGLEG